jgi:hypothetical protein
MTSAAELTIATHVFGSYHRITTCTRIQNRANILQNVQLVDPLERFARAIVAARCNSHSTLAPISCSIMHLHFNIQNRQNRLLALRESLPPFITKLDGKTDLCSKRNVTTSRNRVNGQSPVYTNFLEKRCTRMQTLISFELTSS